MKGVDMEKEFKQKYYGFVCKFISNRKICLTTKIKDKYTEKFFDEAINDNILEEIDKNDIGQRQFIFTEFAREIIN